MKAGEIRDWLVARIAAMLETDPATIDDRQPFDSFGLSSLGAVGLSGELEELLGRTLQPTLVYEYPTIVALAEFLADGQRTMPERSALRASHDDANRQVAIVGIGCRFPGADGPDAYWRLLCDGVDMIREVPSDRWDAHAFFDPDATVPGKTVTRWGGFLDQVDQFDPFFFGISPGEAERMDPQQRLLLELAYESFEDAGYAMHRLAGSRTGVFIGISINEYSFRQYGRPDLISGHSGTGNALSIAANRISYFFDLHGPSMAIDTACSSSLTAIHLACNSLRSGECDLAAVGGVNVVLSPAHSIAFTKAGVLAPDGRCKVFDAKADGYVRGEGGAVVILKPLAQARADGDRIYAVIRGSAVHQDGRTNGLMAPSREAQEAVLREAYRDAGVAPGRVQYVEAHGTGTVLGDAIEARALGAVLATGRSDGACALGSVKSNFGHLEAAAGAAGLVKVALALQCRTIPPSLHFDTANPHIPFEDLGLRVQRKLAPWPKRDHPALAGVSSFGFGGTDVHVVLEEAPRSEVRAPRDDGATGAAALLPLSAQSPGSLAALAREYRSRLSADPCPVSLHDLCAAVARRRNHLDHRVALVAGSTQELIGALDDFLNGVSQPGVVTGQRGATGQGRVAFVFSGQGSQWLGMGRQLARESPVFRHYLEQCDQALKPYVNWSLFDQLDATEDASRLAEIDVVQPVLFAVQVALANLWRSWGVEPDAVVGHSMGEVAAACFAGILALDDGARVICARSRLLRRLRGQGGMAVVALSPDELAPYLAHYDRRLSVAAVNSPRSIVVSGDLAALAELSAAVERDGIFCAPVNVDVASHSPQTAPLGNKLRGLLADVRPRAASIAFVSTVAGTGSDTPLDANYWARNLTDPVQFAGAIDALVRAGHSTFVEIAPHPVLQSSVQQSLIHLDAAGVVVPSTRRDESERHTLLLSLAALYASGRSIAWDKIHVASGEMVPLPSYPWQRERYWLDTDGAGPAWPASSRQHDAHRHPLLGQRIVLAHEPGTGVWQVDLEAESAIFLRDHRIDGQIVVPAAAFIEMALAAAAASGVANHAVLADLALRRSLVLVPGLRRTVQVMLAPDQKNDGALTFTVHSRSAGIETEVWTLHATATVVVESHDASIATADLAALRQRLNTEIRPSDLYQEMATRGLEYGPTLHGIQQVWRGNGEALGWIVLPDVLRHEAGDYHIHPALLDAALQVLAATADLPIGATTADFTYVPVGCGQVRIDARGRDTLWSHVVSRLVPAADASEIAADVHLFDDSGSSVGAVTGLRLARVARHHRSEPGADRDIWQYDVRWQPAAWPAAAVSEEATVGGSNRWLILADRTGVADALQRLLEARGHCCSMVYPEDPVDRAFDERLARERAPLRGAVHLWSAEGEPAMTPSTTSLQAAQIKGCNAALRLVQGLVARAGTLGTPRVWLVTRGVQPVLGEDTPAVSQAPLWGLGRTIGFELPELKCTMIDLDPALDAAGVAADLLRQLDVDDAEDQVALRGGGRWVPRLVPFAPSPRHGADGIGDPVQLRSDGTYLITGGLGGLGLAVARWMITQGARHLVLVGRNAPAGARLVAVEQLRQAGVTVEIVTADVSIAAELHAVFERIDDGGVPLRGVVHAAGVLDNASILNLDAARMGNVLAPKVAGAWNLHVASARRPLDFFVLFSSAVSVLGSPGQGNYAAANTFLDTLAHLRHHNGLPATSINWGPWVDIGLVASGEFLPASAKSGTKGVKGITPERGLEALGQAMREGGAQITVLPFDIAALLELYPTAARMPFFAEVGGSESHVARLYARPALRQDYVAPRNDIEQKLAELWRQTLRIDRVGVHDSFFELGGDSVLAAQIISKAHKTFGVSIDLREAFAAFTIENLALRIESSLVARIADMSESEALRLLAE